MPNAELQSTIRGLEFEPLGEGIGAWPDALDALGIEESKAFKSQPTFM